MRPLRFPLVLLALLFVAGPAAAQPALTLETLFASREFVPEGFRGGAWAEDGPVLRNLEAADGGATSLVEQNLETGDRRTVIDGATLVKPDDGQPLRIESYAVSADGQRVLLYTDSQPVWRLNTQGFYYVFEPATGRVTPLSDRALGTQMFAKLSPDGTRAAFVRNRNLFWVDLATGRETALTLNGAPGGVINGTYDWVYEEEFGQRDGFRWAPDSRSIAYVQLDESATRDFQMIDSRTLYPEVTQFRYPKAGEVNAEIQVGVVNLETRETRFFDTNTFTEGGGGADAAEPHEYLVGLGWTPALADGQPRLWTMRLNRNQNVMELLYLDPASMGVRTVLTEREDSYVEVETGFSDVETGTVTYLRDGRHFVLRSDRTGHSHLYLYTLDGALVRPLTHGDADVTAFHGVDEGRNGSVWVTMTAGPRERHLVRFPTRGGAPVRVTTEPGWHSSNVSRDFRFILNTHSTTTRVPQVHLLRADGRRVSTLVDNAALQARVDAQNLPPAEFMTVPAADGTPLEAYLIRPRDFDPDRRYPLLVHTYGGPGSQEVTYRWAGQERLWHHYLAETYGILVAGVDNRGSGGRGKAFKTLTQNRLGVLEAEDQTAAARWFGAQSYVDPDRIGIWGWSYGGYLSLLAMLYEDGPEVWAAGAAIAPVTDWRQYDTIYTERYLSTPQANPDGYRLGSPVTYADRMRDTQRLLIVHGDADDNVHPQNTTAMVDALIAADKHFEMMIYPGRNHAIAGGRTRLHVFTMLTRFFADALAGEELQAVR